MTLPFFSDLDPAALSRVEAAARYEEVPRGAAVLSEGDAVTDLSVLVRGEVELQQRGRLVSFVEAPAILAFQCHFADKVSDATYVASSDAVVARVPCAALPSGRDSLREPILRALLKEVEALRAERLDAVLSTDDFFDSPNARLIPGPYEFAPLTAYVHVVETERSRLAGLLPPGLRLVPGIGRWYFVVVCDFEKTATRHALGDGRTFAYRETTPFIPCFGFGRTGAFVPELYPNAYMAVVLGREIYGFPKRMGRIWLRDDGVDVVVGNARLVRARWESPEPLSIEAFGAALFGRLTGQDGLATKVARFALANQGRLQRLPWPSPRVFVRKQILSERSLDPREYRVDELVEVPFDVQRFEDIRRFRKHDVSFGPGQHILTGHVHDVYAVRFGLTFGVGRRLTDYRRGLSRRGS